MHTLLQNLPQNLPTFDQFTSLGMAGVMDAMWLWERRTSRVQF